MPPLDRGRFDGTAILCSPSAWLRQRPANEQDENAACNSLRPRNPCIGLKMKILSSVPGEKQVRTSAVSRLMFSPATTITFSDDIRAVAGALPVTLPLRAGLASSKNKFEFRAA